MNKTLTTICALCLAPLTALAVPAAVADTLPAAAGRAPVRVTAVSPRAASTVRPKTAVTAQPVIQANPVKRTIPVIAGAEIPAGPVVTMTTSLGPVRIKLYDDTPAHRDNFLKLVSENFYDSVLFHRVIKDFMVQAGDPKSVDAPAGAMLGAGDPGYTLPAEIDYPRHFHKYGALAAARTGDQVNPERRSSGSQFYIVTGRTYPERTVRQMAERELEKPRQEYFMNLQRARMDEIRALRAANDTAGMEALRDTLIAETERAVPRREVPAEIIEWYTKAGGAPSLDGQYTVFGEVLEGMDIIERIENAATDSHDRPVEDIRILGIKVEE